MTLFPSVHMPARRSRIPWKLVRRFAIPAFVVRLTYYWRFRALVSPRAEVELSDHATWGRGCVIGSFSKVKIDGPFRMGCRVHVGTGCFIAVGTGGLSIGDNVLVGPNSTIVSSNYVYESPDIPLHEQGISSQGITIGSNVWVGANSVILDGTELGDNVVLAAGSVVSGVIPKNAIVRGNPARVLLIRPDAPLHHIAAAPAPVEPYPSVPAAPAAPALTNR